MNRTQFDPDLLEVVAPAGGVVHGQFLAIGGLFGVCNTDAAAGEKVILVRGVGTDLPKAAGAVNAGAFLYFDEDTGLFGTTGTGTPPAIATQAALSGDATVPGLLLDPTPPVTAADVSLYTNPETPLPGEDFTAPTTVQGLYDMLLGMFGEGGGGNNDGPRPANALGVTFADPTEAFPAFEGTFLATATATHDAYTWTVDRLYWRQADVDPWQEIQPQVGDLITRNQDANAPLYKYTGSAWVLVSPLPDDSVTAAQIQASAFAMLNFSGADNDEGTGPAACTCTGARVGDVVVSVIGFAPGSGSTTDFESAITVQNQIQQSALSDLSAFGHAVLLLRRGA